MQLVLGIAFEGCACRAAFHAGVAAALAEARLPIAVAAGASSGAFAAVVLAAGEAHRLPQMWREYAGRSRISFRRILWNRSLFDFSYALRTGAQRELGDLDLRDRAMEALVVATRLRGLTRRVFSSKSEPSLLEPLLGSCFFPPLYGRHVRVRGELLIDGGVVDNLPTELVAARGAGDVIAVVTSPDGRAFKSLSNRAWLPSAAGARVHVIRPRRALPIGAWDFDAGRMEDTISEGHACGRAFAESWRDQPPRQRGGGSVLR